MILAALLATILQGTPTDPAQLLPPAPAGWRFERLELPLSFAPELGLEGFEELRFAPGMFTADSDSYWSYVLALRIDGDQEVDHAFVERFLAGYYQGLIGAVAGGNGIEVGPDDFALDVERIGERFVASIDMIDAFVTGGGITVRLELDAHPLPGATELFGLASPMPQDAPVWSAMKEMRSAWRAARPPAAPLNHLYVAVDQATYDAVIASEFFRTGLSVFEERETVRPDRSYRGAYLYGRRTYLELMPPGAGTEPGGIGIAFAVEVEGGSRALETAASERDVTVFAGDMQRPVDGEEIPWFHALGIERAHANSRLQLFTMEYERSFLEGFHPELAPTAGGIARGPVLERYAALLGASDLRRAGPLREITEIELELDAAEIERLGAVLAAFGYTQDSKAEATMWIGPGLRVVAKESESEGSSRLRGLRMSLSEPIERDPLQLGAATLRFEGENASLRFGE